MRRRDVVSALSAVRCAQANLSDAIAQLQQAHGDLVVALGKPLPSAKPRKRKAKQ